MDDYQSYLKKIHDQLVTPDELIKDIVKEAANKGIRNKSKIIAGEVSEVYDIELDNGQQIIIRMNPSDQKIYFQEQWAIEQCKKIGGIQVPEIL
jgi:flagellar biosynthesis/type III secretory pathway protein FliH